MGLRATSPSPAATLDIAGDVEAGVDVTHRVIRGRDHYFLDEDRDPARCTLDLIAARLWTAFRVG